jgi:HPt (histidine-containing phosphotransfer) domain-containing protein
MGKMEIVSTLVDLYLKVAPELIERVDQALERENYRDLRNVVHEFKGMAQNLGAQKVAYLSYEIEMAALDRRLRDIVFLVAKLKLVSSTLHKILEDHEATVD